MTFALPSFDSHVMRENSSLEQIKRQGYAQDRAGKEKQLRTLAEEFESVLWYEVLKSMEKTVNKKNSLFHGGQAEDMFQDLKNQEMAKDMSRMGNSGLSDMMMREFTRALDAEENAKKLQAARGYSQ